MILPTLLAGAQLERAPAWERALIVGALVAMIASGVALLLSGCAWLNEPAFPPGYVGTGSPEIPVPWDTNPPQTVYVLKGKVYQNQ